MKFEHNAATGWRQASAFEPAIVARTVLVEARKKGPQAQKAIEELLNSVRISGVMDGRKDAEENAQAKRIESECAFDEKLISEFVSRCYGVKRVRKDAVGLDHVPFSQIDAILRRIEGRPDQF